MLDTYIICGFISVEFKRHLVYSTSHVHVSVADLFTRGSCFWNICVYIHRCLHSTQIYYIHVPYKCAGWVEKGSAPMIFD